MKEFERDLKLDVTGEDVRALHTALLLLDLPVPHSERSQARFGSSTHEAVCRFQKHHRLETTGVVDNTTATAIGKAIDESTYSVTGTVTSPDRAGVDRLKVQIVDKNLERDVPLVDAVTDQDGKYQAQ